MSSWLKGLAVTSAPWIPRPIGIAPYRLALIWLRRSLSRTCPSAKVWARNSILSKAFTPPLSDLDLTVFFEREPSAKELATVRETLSGLRRVFPRTGECNLHVRDQADLLSAWMNPFEISRDPTLLEELGASSRSRASLQEMAAHASVFLLRMLESDLHNLRLRPHLRYRKWSAHFTSIAEKTGFKPPGREVFLADPVNTILDAALELSDFESSDERSRAHEALLDFFLHQGLDGHKIGLNQYTRAFLPHRTCFDPEGTPALTGALARGFAGQVSWELWGLSTQYRINGNQAEVLRHLENLKRSAELAYPQLSVSCSAGLSILIRGLEA